MAPTTSLVPPRRLGALLRQSRLKAGWELSAVARGSGLSVVELDDIEHGRRDLDETDLPALVAAYGIEDAGLVPTRSQLVIDLDEGRIAVNQTDTDIGPSSGPDAVLTRYLALVYRLREIPLGTPIELREVDLGVLSSSLTLAPVDVEDRLHRLMEARSDVERDQRRIRRQLLLPLVGVVIAATGIGTLVLVADRGEDPVSPPTGSVEVGTARIATPAIEEAVAVETDLGNGGAVEVNPSS
jgi:transcriptional regulator with XRE-family HTH domain